MLFNCTFVTGGLLLKCDKKSNLANNTKANPTANRVGFFSFAATTNVWVEQLAKLSANHLASDQPVRLLVPQKVVR